MYRRQARTLSGVVEPSQLVISQREVPISPFHIRAGALEHLREPGRVCFERLWLHRAQLPQRSIGRKERSAEALGQCMQWHDLSHRPSRGHAVEVSS